MTGSVEKGKILAYKSEGLSNRSIGKKIHRSHTVINNFFSLTKKRSMAVSKSLEGQKLILLEMKEGFLKCQAILPILQELYLHISVLK